MGGPEFRDALRGRTIRRSSSSPRMDDEIEEDLGMETVLLKPIEADVLVRAIDAAITGLAPRSGKRQRVARH